MDISEAMDIVDNPDNPLFRLFWYGDKATYAAVVKAITSPAIEPRAGKENIMTGDQRRQVTCGQRMPGKRKPQPDFHGLQIIK